MSSLLRSEKSPLMAKRLLSEKRPQVEEFSRHNIQDLRKTIAEESLKNYNSSSQNVIDFAVPSPREAPTEKISPGRPDPNASESDSEEAPQPEVSSTVPKKKPSTPVPPERKNSMLPRKQSQGLARGRSNTQVGTGSPVNGTFLTEVANSISSANSGVIARVDQWELNISPELEQRLRNLEDLVGTDRARSMREAILKEKRMERNMFSALELELNQRLTLEEEAKIEAGAKLSDSEITIHSLREEIFKLKDRLRGLDTAASESLDKLRRRENEAKQLKVEVEATQIKVRGEEVERLKLVDKIKKKEAEVARLKETLEKVSAQLNRTLEENESLSVKLSETSAKLAEKTETLTATQDEMRKKDSELRVLKRNMHLGMPDEFRKLAEKIKDLELERKRKIAAVEEAEKKLAAAEALAKEKEMAYVQEKIVCDAKNKRIEELEKEVSTHRSEIYGERKIRGMENKRLIDRNVFYVSKLQGQEELRVRSLLDNRALENELCEMRKKNIQLLGQVLSLDEAKTLAEKSARLAASRCKELQEKLQLQSTVQRNELGKLHYGHSNSDDIFNNIESDIEVAFPTKKNTSKKPRRSVGGATKISETAPPENVSEATTETRASPIPSPAPSPTPPTQADSRKFETSRAEIGLQHKVTKLEEKVSTEERARIAAQERLIELAEQLLQKEKEQILSRQSATGGPAAKNSYGNNKDLTVPKAAAKIRELHAQNLGMVNRLHETEGEIVQLQYKYSEREEEVRIQKKKINELMFSLQSLEEERDKLHDRVATFGNAAPPKTASPPPAPSPRSTFILPPHSPRAPPKGKSFQI